MIRNQGREDQGRGRIWMRMTAIAEARLRRTATSYCIVDSLAKVQWPLIEEEGVFTRAAATVFLLDIMDSDILHGPVRELHQDNGISNQTKSLLTQTQYQFALPPCPPFLKLSRVLIRSRS
jgi:hypothetical protein